MSESPDPPRPSEFDIFIEGGTVITMDDERRVFVGDVLLRDGKIHALGKRVKPRPGARTVNAAGCFVIPGLIQSHIHLCQALFRGFAEDRPLLKWLEERIWPLEAAHDPASVSASAHLGLAELLLGGTTAALDMGTVHHQDAIFDAAETHGFRLTSGKAMMDKGRSKLTESTRASLDEADELASRWHEKGNLRYAFAPRFILSCSDELMRETAEAARARGCLLHTHSSENPEEVKAVEAATGKPNVVALHELGYSGPDVVLAHCVWLNERERALMAKRGTKIAHCPSTNLKLASGIAPVPDYLGRKIEVGIGADGAPCNNRMSAFSEMRLAALLQHTTAPGALSAEDALYMATRGGARVLGIENDVGSLEKGKRADVVVVDANHPHLRPVGDPYTTLVYAAGAADVRDVFVDGVWRVREKWLVGYDMGNILDNAEVQLDAVAKRAGIKLR